MDWKDLNETADKTSLRRLFARSLDATGNVDERGFYQSIKDVGLGPAEAKTAMDWLAAQKGNQANTAMQNTQIRAMGYNPAAAGRAGAQIGEPEPVEVTRNPLIPSAPPEQGSQRKGNWSLSDWFNGMKAKAEQPQAQPQAMPDAQQIAAQQAAPSGFATADQPQAADLGQIGSASLATAKDDPFSGYQEPALAPGQDLRSANQKVEDSYDPAQSMMGQAQGQAAPEQASPMFQWDPQNDGSNQFQQFGAALSAKLNAEGYKDPSEFLQATYANAVKANAPPMPNQGLLMLGPEGMSKYQGEMQTYLAGLQKAQGLAGQEVMKAKAGLADFAKQYGVNTVEQRKSEIPGGILSDTSKRNEANALRANAQNIEFAAEAIAKASQGGAPNVPQLMMAAPQVIRAYATTLNPGQQLNEGNLMEVSGQMYPELTGPKLISVAAALGRGLRNNDWSGFDTIANSIDATSPKALLQRMNTLVSESRKLNKISMGSYITQAEKPASPATAPNVIEQIGAKQEAAKVKKAKNAAKPKDPMGIL
jgi:hypothetical protein